MTERAARLEEVFSDKELFYVLSEFIVLPLAGARLTKGKKRIGCKCCGYGRE